MVFQNLFQQCQKINRLKERNNRLLHAFTVRREVILLDSVEFVSFLFLKVSLNGFQEILMVLKISLT